MSSQRPMLWGNVSGGRKEGFWSLAYHYQLKAALGVLGFCLLCYSGSSAPSSHYQPPPFSLPAAMGINLSYPSPFSPLLCACGFLLPQCLSLPITALRRTAPTAALLLLYSSKNFKWALLPVKHFTKTPVRGPRSTRWQPVHKRTP